MQPGEVLLVHGAAGGVGLTAVEVGKAMGATVIATASSTEKLEVAASRGADHLINYKTERHSYPRQGTDRRRRGQRDLRSGRGRHLRRQPALHAPGGGRILIIGFAEGRIPQIPANILLVKNVTVIGFYYGYWTRAGAAAGEPTEKAAASLATAPGHGGGGAGRADALVHRGQAEGARSPGTFDLADWVQGVQADRGPHRRRQGGSGAVNGPGSDLTNGAACSAVRALLAGLARPACRLCATYLTARTSSCATAACRRRSDARSPCCRAAARVMSRRMAVIVGDGLLTCRGRRRGLRPRRQRRRRDSPAIRRQCRRRRARVPIA